MKVLRCIRRVAFVGSTSCAVICSLLSVRSFWVCESVLWRTNPATWAVSSQSGFLEFSRKESRVRYVNTFSEWVYIRSDVVEGQSYSFHRFGMTFPHIMDVGWFNGPMDFFATGTPVRYTFVAFPHWMPSVLFAFPLFLWLFRAFRAQYRFRRGQCVNCGYDLRATADRCPECGEPA